MSLTLHSRVDFGGRPWPSPVSEFSLAWLKSNFHHQQVQRRDRVMTAIADGEKRIDKVRKEASGNVPEFGEKRTNGTVYRDAQSQDLQRQAHRVAERQTVDYDPPYP